jgi:hypothetical protein
MAGALRPNSRWREPQGGRACVRKPPPKRQRLLASGALSPQPAVPLRSPAKTSETFCCAGRRRVHRCARPGTASSYGSRARPAVSRDLPRKPARRFAPRRAAGHATRPSLERQCRCNRRRYRATARQCPRSPANARQNRRGPFLRAARPGTPLRPPWNVSTYGSRTRYRAPAHRLPSRDLPRSPAISRERLRAPASVRCMRWGRRAGPATSRRGAKRKRAEEMVRRRRFFNYPITRSRNYPIMDLPRPPASPMRAEKPPRAPLLPSLP